MKKSLVTLAANCHCCFMTGSVHNCFHFLHSCRFMTESVHNCFPFLHSCRFMTESVHNCFHFLHSCRFMTQSVHNCFHFLHSCRFVLTFWHIWQSKVSRFRKTSCILNCKNYQIIIKKYMINIPIPRPLFWNLCKFSGSRPKQQWRHIASASTRVCYLWLYSSILVQ